MPPRTDVWTTTQRTLTGLNVLGELADQNPPTAHGERVGSKPSDHALTTRSRTPGVADSFCEGECLELSRGGERSGKQAFGGNQGARLDLARTRRRRNFSNARRQDKLCPPDCRRSNVQLSSASDCSGPEGRTMKKTAAVLWPKSGPAKMPRYSLYRADCLEWMAEQPQNSIQGIVTDPPYGAREYSDSSKRVLERGSVWHFPRRSTGPIPARSRASPY